MLRRRIIPCLDVSGGRVVKGVEFVNLRDCGEPVDAALRYAEQGADELCWLNITAGDEAWDELLAQVTDAGTRIDVPLTVGGGVSGELGGLEREDGRGRVLTVASAAGRDREARDDHVGPELADDPHDVAQHRLAVPHAQGFLRRLGKAEVDGAGEVGFQVCNVVSKAMY